MQHQHPSEPQRKILNKALDRVVGDNMHSRPLITLRVSRRGEGSYTKRLGSGLGRIVYQVGKQSVGRHADTVFALQRNYITFHEITVGELDVPDLFRQMTNAVAGVVNASAHRLTRMPDILLPRDYDSLDRTIHYSCDMDGVGADFEAGFARQFDCSPSRLSKDQMWSHIDSVPDFYSTLPLVPGAMHLLQQMVVRNHTMLSSSRTEHIAEHKALWLSKISTKLHYTPVLPQDGVFDKSPYCRGNRSVLIDDYDTNTDQWRKAGGLAINHVTSTGTLAAIFHIERTLRELALIKEEQDA